MAKSSRASSRKTNNQKLKARVFGPIESDRAKRLSERLLALAGEAKPARDTEMKEDGEIDLENAKQAQARPSAAEKMEIDSTRPLGQVIRKSRIEKNRSKGKKAVVMRAFKEKSKKGGKRKR